MFTNSPFSTFVMICVISVINTVWFDLAHAEQYFNTYYSYKLDAIVECFGNPRTEPFCVKATASADSDGAKSVRSPQLYRESDFAPISRPQLTSIGNEEKEAFRNYSQSPRRNCLSPGDAFSMHCEAFALAHGKTTVFDKFARAQANAQLRAHALGLTSSPGGVNSEPVPIVIKNLVILIRFPEHRDRFLYGVAEFDKLFNGRGKDRVITPTGSVKTFYQEQSYGKINIESTVVPWVDTTFTELQASGSCSALCSTARLKAAISEVLRIIDVNNMVNFDEFDTDGDGWIDGFTVITSSAAAEGGGIDDLGRVGEQRIWSHKWGLTQVFVPSRHPNVRVSRYSVNPAFYGSNPNQEQIARIGVISHEIGHFLGLGDFYDTSGRSSGLHVYDTMSSSWGVMGTQLLPNNFSPYNKQKLGVVKFKTPVEGRNVIRPSNGVSDSEIYALSGEAFGYDPAETIYIDYWKKSGYAADHPGGLLIYHSDERVTTGNQEAWHPGLRTIPHNGKHAKVRLIQADGKFRLENHPWPKRYDPNVFWNNPTAELSDYGENNLMSWAQLERRDLSKCQTTGNYLYGFRSIGGDKYEFYYARVPRQNCYKQQRPVRGKGRTVKPTDKPTGKPTGEPVVEPTRMPVAESTGKPTSKPVTYPTEFPTLVPLQYPTPFPTPFPTQFPTQFPTGLTRYPSMFPSIVGDLYGTSYPTSAYPTPFPAIVD